MFCVSSASTYCETEYTNTRPEIFAPSLSFACARRDIFPAMEKLPPAPGVT